MLAIQSPFSSSSSSSTSSGKPILRQTPNLLPCAINHNGPIPISKRHWDPKVPSKPVSSATVAPEPSNPESSPQDPSPNELPTQEVHFRGRRLLSRTLRLPTRYTGVVLQATETVLPAKRKLSRVPAGYGDAAAAEEEDDNEEDEDEPIEVKVLEKKARFDEIVLWGHERVPGGGEEEDGGVVRGVGEWIAFAEAIHGFED